MRCVPLFIFLFNAVYAIPEEIEGSERKTVISVLTAAGANDGGGRELTCTANVGCQTDCNCASCSSTYTYMSTTSKCCKNLSNCVAYDPNTCLCSGCSSLYKVNTKGKCVCVPVTGSILDASCTVTGCSSTYTFVPAVAPNKPKCCKTLTNCGSYNYSDCTCKSCVSSIYSLKNGKCVCKTIKECIQYDSTCSCTGCSSTYTLNNGMCERRCTDIDLCSGTVSNEIYTCDGEDCAILPCKYACGNVSFSNSQVSCFNEGCSTTHFTSSNVFCGVGYSCQDAIFTNSVVTCHDDDADSACSTITVNGGTVYCETAHTCEFSTFGPNTTVHCTGYGSCSIIANGSTVYCEAMIACNGSAFGANAKVRCTVDGSCGDMTLDGNGTTVDCVTLHSCASDLTFTGGACCSSGYCPTGSACVVPTPAPTSAKPSTPTPTTPTPKPLTPAPTTPAPVTPAPTNVLLTVMCPSGQYVTGLRIEFGAAINQIFGLLCSGRTSYLATDGMGAHVHDTDLTESPTNSGGYCQYSVGLLLYTPINTVSSGLTLKDCSANNVSQGPYGSPSKDVQQFTCPTGKKYVGISGTSESWTDTFGVYYPALLSQFSMICG